MLLGAAWGLPCAAGLPGLQWLPRAAGGAAAGCRLHELPGAAGGCQAGAAGEAGRVGLEQLAV